MPETILSQLGVRPPDIARLPHKNRTRIINLLIRWQQERDALACLEAIEPLNLVSLQDLKAQALDQSGRHASALHVMKWRIQKKESPTAQSHLATYYAHDGDHEKALTIANTLVEEHNTPLAWNLLGEVQLTAGNLDAAESAFLQLQSLAPRSRLSKRDANWGLCRIHQQRGDLVTATAYAVRAFTVEEGDPAVPVPLLRQLHRFFEQIGDHNRLQEAADGLDIHLTSDLATMRRLIDADPVQPETDDAPKRVKKRRRDVAPKPSALKRPTPPPLPDLTQIPVSADEEHTITTAVADYFGFPSLRPAQLQILACALRGEDVLAILPTGAGKSLCYQLPAVLDSGVTLVISPLIALMKDQVDSLPEQIKERALALNSSLDGSRLQEAITEIAAGKYKLVYAAPERLRQRPFIHALRQARIARLVIDEAHCVSTWGHDFRPDYLWIRQAHQDLGAPPVLAMTATAPPLVRQDIERRLFGRLANPESTRTDPLPDRHFRYIARDTFRANLRLLAIEADDKDHKMYEVLNLCQRIQGSGIVYARSRKQCEELADLLRQQGLKAEHYHARIDNRPLVQNRFMRGETDIIVATVAFGMGVDKADIRFIIHFGLPNSINAYYQEAGRAGRDGQTAYCILVHSRRDRATLKRLVKSDSLEVDFLRSVYSAVKMKARERDTITVSLDDLARYLKADSTAVRVAISTLEQAQLLQRHYDLPRSVMLQREVGYAKLSSENRDFETFSRLAKLPHGRWVTRNFFDLMQASKLDITTLEKQLLDWQAAGLLSVTANGRNALLTLLDPPADAPTRIASLLDQYNAVQQQRITDIGDYAKSTHCRHGYLANYLGGAPRPQCEQCDNCHSDSGTLLPHDTAADNYLPAETEQMRWILAALEEQSWGKRSLIRILRGDDEVSERGLNNIAFGALTFRTERALGQLIVKMIRQRLLREKQLDHGGIALEVPRKGLQFLYDHGGVPLPSHRPLYTTSATANSHSKQPPPPPTFDDDFW